MTDQINYPIGHNRINFFPCFEHFRVLALYILSIIACLHPYNSDIAITHPVDDL